MSSKRPKKIKNRLFAFYQTKLQASAIYYSLLFIFLIGALLTSFIVLYNAYGSMSLDVQSNHEALFSMHGVRNQLESQELPDNGAYTVNFMEVNGTLQISDFGIFKRFSYKVDQPHFQSVFEGLLMRKDSKLEETIIMSNSSFPLSVSGGTRIEGRIKVPERGVKRTFVSSGKRDGSPEINAQEIKTDESIPGIKLPSFVFHEKDFMEVTRLDHFNSQKGKHAFGEETLLVKVGNHSVSGVSLSGNMILWRDDSISISNDVVLEDVIVSAPIIHIQGGAQLQCQLMATEKIYIGDEVKMAYPSAVMLKNENSAANTDFENVIEIGEKADIRGAVILHHQVSKKGIRIDTESTIRGVIYSTGSVELKDDVKVEGRVITNKFYRKTPSSEYDNLLLNVTIEEGNENFYNGLIEIKNEEQSPWTVLKENTYLDPKSTDTPYWNQ